MRPRRSLDNSLDNLPGPRFIRLVLMLFGLVAFFGPDQGIGN
jgi:hypothetical protein